MQSIINILLATASVITSIMTIALGITLFVYPETDTTVALLDIRGIMPAFIILAICELIKWPIIIIYTQNKRTNLIQFFIVYGLLIIAIAIITKVYIIAASGLVFICCYFLMQKHQQIMEQNE